MPTYGYQCERCGHVFEMVQRVSDPPVRRCQRCRGKVNRLFYPVGIVFKGSGFHVTDYGRGNGRSASSPREKEKAKSGVEKTDEGGSSALDTDES